MRGSDSSTLPCRAPREKVPVVVSFESVYIDGGVRDHSDAVTPQCVASFDGPPKLECEYWGHTGSVRYASEYRCSLLISWGNF